MTRFPILADGFAVALGAAGLTLLARPAAVRRLLGIADSEAVTYALRISGAMVFAAALFLGGFATAWWLTQ